MERTGLVPVFSSADPEHARRVIKACYDGGVRVFEFTNRGDFATLVFAELSRWVQTELPEMILGVGSVLDEGTASMYLALGAAFVVAPVLDEATARVCNRRKVLWVPGIATATEINRAHELGAEIVKLFPAGQQTGADFIQSVRGPMPWTRLMPTGGVSPDTESLSAWFKAGAACVGMGSELFAGVGDVTDPSLLIHRCKSVLETIAQIKKLQP